MKNGATGTSALNPAPIQFDKLMSVDAYNDITPRFGVAYDVFGNGRTAAQVQHGPLPRRRDQRQRLHAQQPGEPHGQHATTAAGPTATTTRSWTATCCVLTANGECAALTGNNLNFGSLSAHHDARVNPATLKGWGVRENDWQWGVTVQQEAHPAHVGRSRLRAPLVQGCHRDRQPAAWSGGLRRVDDHGAERLAAAGRRRLPDHALHGDGGGGRDRGAQNTSRSRPTSSARPTRTTGTASTVTFNARLRQGLTFCRSAPARAVRSRTTARSTGSWIRRSGPT